jgi:hypothetical protein
MPQGKVNRKTTIWLGNEEATADGYGFDVHSEDDMIAIEGSSGGERFEIFILPDLFPYIRRVMDGIEGRKERNAASPAHGHDQ